jgi:Skp family chaperone for outer membrane proteins
MYRERTNQLQDKDLAYQKDIRKRRDDMAITINKEIKQVVNSLAQHRKLELILQCPDVAVPEEENSLTDAMRRMTAPATWIAWRHPGIDITEEVIRWLNHYYPAPGGTAPSGVTPTSGSK